MSTENKIVGVITEKLIPQPEYPQKRRSGGLWELTMLWQGLLEDLYKLAPAYRIEINDESVHLDEQTKRDFGRLKCADVDIVPNGTSGYGFMTATFLQPEAPEFEDTVDEEWTTNSVYKEIALTVDDIDESDYSPGGNYTLEEWKENELKILKAQGQATRATADVQLQYRKKFKGAFNTDSIIGTIGQDGTPPGLTGNQNGTWKHISKSIQKSKADKTESNTYQFYNETE